MGGGALNVMGSTTGPATEMVLSNSVALNCSSNNAFSLATIALRFWDGNTPPSVALPASNNISCTPNTLAGCTGPLLQANMPLTMLPTFMAQFSATTPPGLTTFPVRGTSSDVSVRLAPLPSDGSLSWQLIQITSSQITNRLAIVNLYPQVINTMCAACGATVV